MCTVTVIKDDNGGFVLTSNRDELVHRETELPQFHTIGVQNVLFPRDRQAGGTWIAMDTNGLVCCLLNGAFEPHTRKATYRKSRGQVLLDVFRSYSVDVFLDMYNFNEIEPFTLVVFENSSDVVLREIRWDGEHKHISVLDTSQPHIWSSATLYSEELKKKRKDFFRSWHETKKQIAPKDLLSIHSSTDSNDGFVLKGEEGIETVSITQIQLNVGKGVMTYYDLINKTTTSNTIGWKETLQLS